MTTTQAERIRRRWPGVALTALLVAHLAALSAAAPAAAADVAPYSASAAPEWTALFARRSGWTGADGAYSIPLSADERPGAARRTRTLWLFGDTFVGRVRADGSRADTVMVNNTTVMLEGGDPDPARMQFPIRRDAAGAAVSTMRPAPRLFRDRWFWPTDGVAVGDTIYLYALRMRSSDGGPGFGFATDGISLLAARADETAPFTGAYAQRDMPLFIAGSDARKETVFGTGVMPNTQAARAPNPDGHVYVYGTRSGEFVKSMVVARVPVERIAEANAYRFWDGAAWQPEIGRAATVAHGVSAEASVTPLPDGRFLMVHMSDLLGHTVMVRYGASPVGPWGEPIPVWDCPEPGGLTPDTWVYGAKAHPHLSRRGELLLSYSVNSFDFAEQFEAGGAQIYRPRFIRLPLP